MPLPVPDLLVVRAKVCKANVAITDFAASIVTVHDRGPGARSTPTGKDGAGSGCGRKRHRGTTRIRLRAISTTVDPCGRTSYRATPGTRFTCCKGKGLQSKCRGDRFRCVHGHCARRGPGARSTPPVKAGGALPTMAVSVTAAPARIRLNTSSRTTVCPITIGLRLPLPLLATCESGRCGTGTNYIGVPRVSKVGVKSAYPIAKGER